MLKKTLLIFSLSLVMPITSMERQSTKEKSNDQTILIYSYCSQDKEHPIQMMRVPAAEVSEMKAKFAKTCPKCGKDMIIIVKYK